MVCTTSSIPAAVSNDFLSKYQITLPRAVSESLASTVSSTMQDGEAMPLPDGYKPSQYDIHCGRGKGCYNKSGNKRFRAVVQQYIPDYITAKTKYDKTAVLNAALDRVKAQNNGNVFFVSRKNGRWHTISEDQAREKVGHQMREAVLLLEGADDRREEQKHFDSKHRDLLQQQRAIFKCLTSSLNKKEGHFKQARRSLTTSAA